MTTGKVDYWDDADKTQKVRDATSAELADLDNRQNQGQRAKRIARAERSAAAVRSSKIRGLQRLLDKQIAAQDFDAVKTQKILNNLTKEDK